MVLPRTWFLFVCEDLLPSFELQIQVLSDFSQHVDEEKAVVKDSVLIFSPEAKNSIMGELIAIGGFQLISLYDLMSRDALMHIGLIAYGKDEWVKKRSACKGDEDEILIELFLFIDTATDHHSTAEESGCMMFDI